MTSRWSGYPIVYRSTRKQIDSLRYHPTNSNAKRRNEKAQ
jgi:hypothetical protein